MIIKDINKRIKNTPDNINEELAPITDEYIKSLFEEVSDESNPLDYYTKVQVDSKIQNVNNNISTVNTKLSTAEKSINNRIDLADSKITTLENKVKNITYSTVEPTEADGINGDLWIIYDDEE